MSCDNGNTGQPYDAVDWEQNYREHPSEYVIGTGQFGVLKYEPYKSEILPLWEYADEAAAKRAAPRIYALFEWYVDNDDFVGADMAKKFLHMGFTRAMRYAKYPGGQKYDEDGTVREAHGPDTTGSWADPSKRDAACVFKEYWDAARSDETYQTLKALHESGDLYEQSRLGSFE